MERSTPAQQQAEAPPVFLSELSIVLIATHIDAAHINPDFLRYNEIVGSDWQIDPPVIIEPGFSLVEYENGLSFTATEHNLRITHRGGPLAIGEIVSPSVASRYLAMAPWPVEYNAVNIDLIGLMDVTRQGIERRLSPLHRLSSGMHFRDTAPNVQTRVFYQLADKSIRVYISESGDADFVNGVRFNANISRGVDSDLSLDDRIDFIDSVIENWRTDYVDFVRLASRFYHNYGN